MNRIPLSLIWTACAILGWVIVAILVLSIFGGLYSIHVAHSILRMPPPPSVAAQFIFRP